ncbi:MAG: Hsp70 family protein [Deltaproteobacteria bacterium]|jgi:molecular chaperone DnaK (HSP70)|nr:Hsp70 family protein [Deltaproteobacteria bacterium]MBW2534520.1 Hsp70 family protein [Deltaproteobacteria bacterium]
MSSSGQGRRIVGIDLGTTHTVVAWTEPEPGAEPQLFEVPQLVAPAEIAPQRLLPSTLYAPLEAEQTVDPWGDAPWIVGEHARRRGGEVPGRAVASAKSWLSHAAVDRTADILPWHAGAAAGDEQDEVARAREALGGKKKGESKAPDAAPRLSPVPASTRLLLHVRRAWDEAYPDHPLADQDVVLTVPASFDAVGRQLTVLAAEQAGLRVRLLEEPQAAFYDFMQRGGEQALEHTLAGDAASATVLVCDVGGGTTDLSLIRVVRRDGPSPFEVERVAVGRHLLLGGDNMDLTLAHLCERRLVKEGDQLGARRFAQLVFACRAAKEQLLTDPALDQLPITLLAAGSKLVGKALKTELGREEVLATVLDGFFPEVALTDRSPVRRAGIVAFGLPYERDVAVTRHLAGFLARHLDEARPSALLLNGGVFRAQLIIERLARTVRSWLQDRAEERSSGEALLELAATDPDVAVARGAVAYGLALRGLGTRIGSGAAQGYYVGVGRESDGEADRAMCILPRGAQEGVRHQADKRVLELTVGRPVRFELYATESGRAHGVGEVVDLDEQRFQPLPPVVATLPGTGDEGDEGVPVVVEAELSAIGTVELACVELAAEGDRRRFALAFDLRSTGDGGSGREPDGARRSLAPVADRQHGYGKRFDEAREAIERVFGKGRQDVHPREVKGILRNLERILGPRATWTMSMTRGLFDALWPWQRGRRRSADHERMFWLVAGYCLRPGFGDARDPERVRLLWKLFEARLAFGKEVRSWPQFWIAWRRVAAGLGEPQQERLRDVVDPFLAPSEKRLKIPKAFRNEAVHDMLDLAASLERIDSSRRRELGEWVLERTWTDRDPRLWAALGRIGARVPTYGSVHQVVPVRAVERWSDHLLRERWDELPTAPRAAMSMCRVTNDRARDVAPRLRQRIADRLRELDAPEHFQLAVQEYVAPNEEEHAAFYGEELPVGLRLVE